MPWDSCAFGADYTQGTYGLGEVPQVTATLGFCEENCPGVQLSTMNEWLGLLTSWVLPAIALLLVCSTGKRNKVVEIKPETSTLDSLINKVLTWVPYPIQEFMAILGDPASAIRGAFSEVALDVKMMQDMMHDMCCQERFDTLMKALAIVAGPTKFDEKVEAKFLWKGLLVVTGPFMTLDGMASLRKVLFKLDKGDRPLLEYDSDRHEVIKELRLALIHGQEDGLRKCLQALQRSLRRDSAERDPERDSESDPLRSPSKECIQGQLQDAVDEVDKVLERRSARIASGNEDYSTRHAEIGDPETRYAWKEEVEVESAEIGSTGMKGGDKKPLEESTFEQWVGRLKTGIQATLKGRIDFMKGVFLPVILGGVATGASFYSAYTQLGDNDTAHSLAYGVWYSWVIILAVVSNCYVATANPGLAKLALEHEVFLSDVTVPLRKRSENAQKWMKWLKDIGCVKDGTGSALREQRSEAWSLLKLLFKQTLAWICVAMPCACAASISFTTPTVGLGCRSFNHLLYGSCTLVLSWLSVYRSQVDETNHPRSQRVFLRALYIFGIGLNVFILIGGTLFHLIGLYRNCRCEVLFVSKDFLLQMSSNTALDVANAKKFWLPVGYMDFGFIWIVCAIALVYRGYINSRLKIFLKALDRSWADVGKPEKSNHSD